MTTISKSRVDTCLLELSQLIIRSEPRLFIAAFFTMSNIIGEFFSKEFKDLE